MKLVAKAILYRDDEVLLQLRDDKPDIQYPGWWSLPGGKVEDDELPAQAAIREVREEFGIVLDEITKYTTQHRTAEDYITDHIFAAEVDVDEEDVEVGEGQLVRYHPVDSLDSIDFVPPYAEVTKDFFQQKSP